MDVVSQQLLLSELADLGLLDLGQRLETWEKTALSKTCTSDKDEM